MTGPDASGGAGAMDVIVQQAPRFALSEAVALGRTLYGLEAAATPLPSERDQNVQLTTADGSMFVLKIANATERLALLELQNAAMAHVTARAPSLLVPRVRDTLDGRAIARTTGADGRQHYVRLLTWVPGVPLVRVRPHAPALLESLGHRLAEMDRALADFTHPALDRPFPWDLKTASWAAAETPRIADAAVRERVERLLSRFAETAAPALSRLRMSAIHNDWNDHNVLVSPMADERREVVGVVDFGDMVRSHTVCDLAVAAAYAMLGKPDPLAAAAAIVGGYHRVLSLDEAEIAPLFDLIATRLCLSAVMAARQQAVAPGNAYLDVSQHGVRDLLEHVAGLSPDWAHYRFRHACGLEPCPRSRRVVAWLTENRERIGPVIEPDPASAPCVVFDLGAGSLDPVAAAGPGDANALSAAVNDRMREAGAAIGVGRHDEPRLVYAGARFLQPGNDGEQARTVHLGLDLFVPPGTAVRAPIDGVVHSFADNATPLDYGPTIVLAHRTDAGDEFHTLYGHLSRESLDGLRPGLAVRGGDRIGTIGDVGVNGGWPPHLHFQLIVDLLGRRGDCPGVAAPAERDLWLAICPDPNVLVGIPASAFPCRPAAPSTILERRRLVLGHNLSLSYRAPLTIVRGHMQHLYDVDGRRYLDCVNNVAHVGHCHPRIVGAERAQAAVLNTNTRYLHEHIVRYAERLVAMLPGPLSVCFFVNSGSEANELAIRLALAHTGQAGFVVVDGAYHGHTSRLVEISPYKADGPGGRGLPAHVRKVTMPDLYRGPHRANDAHAGARYAGEVTQAVTALATGGHGVAAFFCESLLSCGGQIVLPDGYLREAYGAVRAAGGVCVADEVQVGFGRIGTHMWGFETQDVVPDIVTMGKPIGNGYPLGAVVTTEAVAASFASGMEFFSTFGGNPVACAVGLAVLDVIRDEALQEQARVVGTHLRERLEALAARHAIVGDVRGLGLFLGIELVQDRDTRVPAPRQAAYVVNRLRDRGVLTSTDGPDHNVIKIKPPLVFTSSDAEHLAGHLDEVLGEDPAQP